MPTLRTRLYGGVERLVRAAATALRVLHEGVWLGLLDRRQLHEITERQYLRWRHYRAADYNLEGLKGWEARAFEDHFPKRGSILVGSAGGGREVIALLRLGYRVTAFECVRELAESCRALVESEGLEADILTAEPDGVPGDAGIHDGAVLGWGAYMHIPGRSVRVALLRSIRCRLRPGGPLLLSYFVRRGAGRAQLWKATIAQALRRLRLSPEMVEVGDSLERTFDHWFTEAEIRSELEEAGFETVFSTAEPYGHAIGLARTQNR